MFNDLKTYPAVFAVKDDYQIFIAAKSEIMVSVEVNGQKYYDHSNGIMRSGKFVHSVVVPMEELDNAEKYTVCYRKVIDRRPYFTKTEDEQKIDFNFRPIKSDTVRLYHISDTHNKIETPIKAALYKEFDLLILNGDVPEDSRKIEHFDTIYYICGEVTKGEIPIVFSRGNHDLRGVCAENLSEYTPCNNGKSYYTFKLGPLWGVVMDCGEDKPDDHVEYGYTVCCEAFRREVTRFLEKVVKEEEYKDESIKYKMVICHVPFFEKFREPYNIDEDLHDYWTKLLRENIKPDIMFAGHHHLNEIRHIGCIHDYHNQPCPSVIGSNPCLKLQKEEGVDKFIGCYTELKGKEAYVEFNDSNNEIFSTHHFLLGEEDNGDI